MSKKILSRELNWKCHIPNLFQEILNNPGCSILKIPLSLTQSILAEVAERAITLNDPILNELMCDLQLYETPNIGTPEYNLFIKKVRTAAYEQKIKEPKRVIKR